MKLPLHRPVQFIVLYILTRIKWPITTTAALFEMQELVETQSTINTNLDLYMEKQDEKLKILKLKLKHYKRQHGAAERDIPTYISNPINAYLLTKRLTLDWGEIENLMAQHDTYHLETMIQGGLNRISMSSEENQMLANQIDTLEYLAFGTLTQGNLEYAFKITNELLQLKPDHERAIRFRGYLEKQLAIFWCSPYKLRILNYFKLYGMCPVLTGIERQ